MNQLGAVHDESRPKVSVCMITYNHESYISAALESVLEQDVDFDYEIVVSDDASTDATPAIVRDYAARYPGVIRPLLRTVNVGGAANFTETIRAARGEYIAVLDGDDYWTAPHKLRMQVAFLDAHRDYSHCFHNVEVVYPGGERCLFRSPTLAEEWSLADVLAHCGCVAPPGSYVFRRGAFGSDFPEWWLHISHTLNYGDWPLVAANAEYGRGRYFRDVLGVYRSHGKGIWSNYDFAKQTEVHILAARGLMGHFGREHGAVLRALTTDLYGQLVSHHARDGRLADASRVLVRGFREAHDWRNFLTLTKTGVPALAAAKLPPRMRAAIRRTIRRAKTPVST
ncbi:MAG: glycosyltransferase family 2 protein [Polyangiaceae bacterium]